LFSFNIQSASIEIVIKYAAEQVLTCARNTGFSRGERLQTGVSNHLPPANAKPILTGTETSQSPINFAQLITPFSIQCHQQLPALHLYRLLTKNGTDALISAMQIRVSFLKSMQ
jgi:hypothetical protein